jgi:hypothetical protein
MLDEIGREARFATRRHAGRVLAARLRAYAGRDDVLVLGLDLYSLHRSIECVLQYLEKVDPEGGAASPAALQLLRRLRRGRAGLWVRNQFRAVSLMRGRRDRPTRRASQACG